MRTRTSADDPEIPSRHAMPLRICSFDLGAGATGPCPRAPASVAASRLGRLASTRQVSGGSAQEPQCPSGTCRLHAPAMPAWRRRTRFVGRAWLKDRPHIPTSHMQTPRNAERSFKHLPAGA
ncbi:hypothetical protein ADT26_01700 [Xanthomonas oryzae]|nr:hypothetical protein ADT26_01700 [Xanthomonas oryzae]